MNLKEFRAALGREGGVAPGSTVVRFTAADVPAVEADSRVATFVFSDNSVDRYGDTIDARGWVLDKFMSNPVALFGHDANSVENVIGKAKNVRVEGQRLIGEIEFMEASVNPNAEAVFQMVKGGFLNAVSVGFAPVEWSLTKDKSRPQGVDFKKQELLEISIVPIPANPSALVQARAAGIDVDRLGLLAGAEVVVTDDEVSADKTKRRGALLARKVLGRKTKGLYDLGCFAELMAQFGMLTNWVEWEAEMEGDGSNVPSMLIDILFDMADAFMAMTQEEVSEFLSLYSAEPDTSGLNEVDVGYVTEGKSVAARCFRAGRVKARNLSAPAVEKAGKVLSSDNEKKLRDAHDMLTKGCETIMGVIGANLPDETEEKSQTTEDDGRELRIRRARALKLQIETAA